MEELKEWEEWDELEGMAGFRGFGGVLGWVSDMFPALWTQKELAELDELAEM